MGRRLERAGPSYAIGKVLHSGQSRKQFQMKKSLVLLTACLLAGPARSGVRVFVQDTNGAAVIKYECTAGEIVRSFALDVRVDKGRIVGISDFFRGESKMGTKGMEFSPPPFAITSRSAPGQCELECK